ncbi:MAG: S8 family serine peptidase [Lentisphaeria bacterium]|nr:S8 family serine peptidase [Candidatus Neomarinimicrobiota bacterium]MCF7843023.1 S8 family serine peptidase [Lentisphaeria bacterium]
MRKPLLIKIAFFTTLLFTVAVFGGPDPLQYDQKTILARFHDDMSAGEIQLTLNGSGISIHKLLVRCLNIWSLKVDTSFVTLENALSLVRNSPGVIHAQYDHFVAQRSIPDDPEFGNQWAFQNTGQSGGTVGADIDAVNAWDITTGGTTALGREIVVAVVDNGIQLNHPDLEANIWTNEDEIPGNGVDDDNNGYVDDVHGWNAYNSDGNLPQGSHGTHVSGTVGAVSDNDNQVAGVNWDVKIMLVAGSTTLTSVALEAYGYVLDQKSEFLETNGASGAFVVATNSSFGVNYADCESGTYPLWNDIYTAMGEVGILSAVATMNINANVDTQGDVPTGCSSPYLVSVTNTTRTDTKNSSAAYGAESIDLGAPGSSILSTDLSSSTSYKSGTSMATPHVAGAIALLHAAANSAFASFYETSPAAGALLLKEMLLENVDVIPALENITVSGGRLNLFRAAQAVHNYAGGTDTTHLVLTIEDTVLTAVNGTEFPAQIFLTPEDTTGRQSSILTTTAGFLNLIIYNTTVEPRTWTLMNTEMPVVEIPALDSVSVIYPLPPPGVYLYGDTSRFQQARGLAGMLVRKSSINDTTRVFDWVLTEWDTVWLSSMHAGIEPEFPSYNPQFFTINGLSAPEIFTAPETQFQGQLGEMVRIQMANPGLLPHTLHFHGFHVNVVARNGLPITANWKDSVPVPAGETITMTLMLDKTGTYPVYDANLLSVTGAGVWLDGMLLQIVVEETP